MVSRIRLQTQQRDHCSDVHALGLMIALLLTLLLTSLLKVLPSVSCRLLHVTVQCSIHCAATYGCWYL